MLIGPLNSVPVCCVCVFKPPPGICGEVLLKGAVHKEMGLKGEMAQLIKAPPFIICLCFSPFFLLPHSPPLHRHQAEKMRRQRLYSNVIREQNKKISRMPFQPAKNLQGADKKVPRVKVCRRVRASVCEDQRGV